MTFVTLLIDYINQQPINECHEPFKTRLLCPASPLATPVRPGSGAGGSAQLGADLSQNPGAKTMTATLRAHIAAPTSPQANTAQEAIAAHVGVHNCLSMAAWHIAKGNTPAAARKVRQALAALRQLDKLEA